MAELVFDRTGDGTGEFSPKVPSSSLIVGPHCLLTYDPYGVGLVLNDRLSSPEPYWVEEFTGFEDSDLRISDEERPQHHGFTPGPGYYGVRVMTMTGWVQAGTYPKAMDMSRVLLDAFLDLSEKPLRIAPREDSPYFKQPAVDIWCRKADKIQISPHVTRDDQTGLFKRAFTIALKATNPVYRSVTPKTISFTPTVISSLGFGFDLSFDLSFTQQMNDSQDPVSGQNSAEIINVGNWFSTPVVRFTGGQESVELLNIENGQRMRLTENVADGDWIEVDVERGTVVDSVGNNRFSAFDETGDWLVLEGARGPHDGSNQLSLIASGLSGSPSVSVSAYDTWM